MKNGVDRQRPAFTPWFWSGRIPAKIEGAIVICVFAAVIAIMGFLFEMPGPLVVHVQDDVKEAIKGARVSCTSPDGATAFAGQTDVFGEAKWPGLSKGAWKCEVNAPDRYHAAAQVGYATVVARHPAMWITVVERPARLVVQVVRPSGAPRAKVAVRAVCGLEERVSPATGGARRAEQTIETWEARAGLLDGRATLFVPHGVPCRAGLVFPELPGDGPSTQSKLDCDAQPCTATVTGGVGQELSATLTPTVEQWAAVRPPPEPDKP